MERCRQCCVLFDPSIPTKWRRVAVAIVVTWGLLGIPMALFAPKFIQQTHLDFEAPPGSDSEKAQNMMNAYFPTFGSSVQMALIISSNTAAGVAVPNDVVKEYSEEAEKAIQGYPHGRSDWPSGVTVNARGYYVGIGNDSDAQAYAHEILVSKNNRSTILVVTISDPTGSHGLTALSEGFVSDFGDFLRNDVVDIPHPGFDVEVTGMSLLGVDGMRGTMKDIESSDSIIIPLSFLIFTYYVRSLRLLILPLLTLGLSIGGSFALVYPIARYTSLTFQTVVPQCMMSCCLAICLDYNLFLLTRFREGMELGFSVYRTLHAMVTNTALHTIAISGILITLAWFGMMLIPVEPLMTQGLGSGLSVVVVMLVNVTVTPAMLAIFPTFFKQPTKLTLVWKALDAVKSKLPCSKTHEPEADATDDQSLLSGKKLAQPEQEVVLESPADVKLREKREEQRRSMWYRVAKFVERRAVVVIIVVLAIGAPFYSQVPNVETSLDPFMFAPRDAPSVVAWRAMEKSFSPGLFLPYYLLAVNTTGPRSGNGSFSLDESGFFSETGYRVMGELHLALQNRTLLNQYPPYTAMESPYNLNYFPPAHGPAQITWDDAVLFSRVSGVYKQLLSSQMTQPYHEACFVTIFTPFQPTGHNATIFMKEVKEVMTNFTNTYPEISLYLSGGNTVSRDYNAIVDRSTPVMLGGIVGFVVLVVLVAFRSVLIPLRMALTIGYTVATTFGFSYYVFQTNAFHWLFPYLSDFKGDALMWLVPSMAISITVALGMDYDVFLLTRIYEYRITHRFGDNASIVKGLHKTGRIITGAGIIMTVAFAGLLLSGVVALNQFGMLLCISVLLDTFIVRSLFVPATMFLAGKANWWPRNVPEHGLLSEDDFDDEMPGDEHAALN